jgi:hypothetical protein
MISVSPGALRGLVEFGVMHFERTRLRAGGKKTYHGYGCDEFSYFCFHDSNEPK